MNEFPSGLLLYVLILAAVVLFNYAIRRRRLAGPRQLLPAFMPCFDQRTVDTARRMPRAAAGTAAAGEPDILVRRVEAPAALPTTRAVADARSLVTGRRNLRRAVIAMTVLARPVPVARAHVMRPALFDTPVQ